MTTVTTRMQSYFEAVCTKQQQTTASDVFKQKMASVKAAIGHYPERKIKPQFLYMWMSYCIHMAMSGELKTMLMKEGTGSPEKMEGHFMSLYSDLQLPKNSRTWRAFYITLTTSLCELLSDTDNQPVCTRSDAVLCVQRGFSELTH